jgi:hypothetical protein
MKTLADALVYAVTYINLRKDESDEIAQQDVEALESIAGFLQDGATKKEEDALAAAAERALAAELKHRRPRKVFVRDYKHWMEEMFHDGDWVGNKRARGKR